MRSSILRLNHLTSIRIALAATLAVAACGSKSASPVLTAPSAPSSIGVDPVRVRRVVVLGDSLAVSPSREQGFPSELQTRITRQGLPWTVTNAGSTGDTTAGGLGRVRSLLASDVGVLVVALGANDGLRGVPISTIDKNLSAIIEMAKQQNIAVLLCGMETPPTRGWDYTVAFHYVFPDLAQRYSIPLVPFLLAGVALSPDLNGPDGIHPNAAGAQRIADTVWPYLQPLLVGVPV